MGLGRQYFLHCSRSMGDILAMKLKSTKGLNVHTLTYYFPDKDDGKVYEYTGDHSSFCDGIDAEYLKEVKDDSR